MAFYKAQLAGHEVASLLTFIPRKANFLAHPLPFMKYQSKAIGVPHHEAVLDAPLEKSYEKAIRSFKEKHKIDALITGDMSEVEGHQSWIRQRCERNSIEVITPLWGADRCRALSEFISCGFRAIISYIKIGCLTEEWLCREINEKYLNDMVSLNNRTGIDMCGENGEYHTLVLDGPLFKKRIIVGNYAKHITESAMYAKPQNVTLSIKA